jgi:hypothetical protein
VSIETAITALLATDSTVSGIVGSRIYPSVMPTGTAFPAVVYQRISTPRWNAMDNACDTPHARIAITCWAATMAQIIALSRAVENVLAGFVGTAPESPPSGTYVQAAYVIDERDTWLWEAGQMLGLYRRDIDFEISWTEPALGGPPASSGGAMGYYVGYETPADSGDHRHFTLAHAPNPSFTLQLFLNGMLLDMGVDFSLQGNAITLSYVPQGTFELLAFYGY